MTLQPQPPELSNVHDGALGTAQQLTESRRHHPGHAPPAQMGQPQPDAASQGPQALKALPPKFAALLAQRRAASLGPPMRRQAGSCLLSLPAVVMMLGPGSRP